MTQTHIVYRKNSTLRDLISVERCSETQQHKFFGWDNVLGFTCILAISDSPLNLKAIFSARFLTKLRSTQPTCYTNPSDFNFSHSFSRLHRDFLPPWMLGSAHNSSRSRCMALCASSLVMFNTSVSRRRSSS